MSASRAAQLTPGARVFRFGDPTEWMVRRHAEDGRGLFISRIMPSGQPTHVAVRMEYDELHGWVVQR